MLSSLRYNNVIHTSGCHCCQNDYEFLYYMNDCHVFELNIKVFKNLALLKPSV